MLYEAYYPEEQESVRQSPKIYQEKRYFDRPTVPERSYQIPFEPYEVNSFDPEASAESSEDYLRLNSAGLTAAFTGARPQAVQNDGVLNGEEELNEEYVIFGEQVSPMSRESSRNLFPIAIEDDYSIPRSQAGIYGNGYRGEPHRFVEENRMDFRGPEEVQRIVPINDEFIFGEKPTKFEEPLKNYNDREGFETRSFGAGYEQRNRIQPVPIENIFEPRPQVINYVFSNPKKTDTINPVEDPEAEPEENEWPRNYGDNLIEEEIKKADEQELKKEEAKVTSIQVSQVPRHKIRHHHGEMPKRNWGHN